MRSTRTCSLVFILYLINVLQTEACENPFHRTADLCEERLYVYVEKSEKVLRNQGFTARNRRGRENAVIIQHVRKRNDQSRDNEPNRKIHQAGKHAIHRPQNAYAVHRAHEFFEEPIE